jgi:hypothetical protein
VRYGLMNEYGVDWPFWSEDGPYNQGVPSLPPRLIDEVLAWTNDFNTNYSVEAGWPTEVAARSHERQGRRLLQLVRRELEPEDEVVFDYWETNRRKGL